MQVSQQKHRDGKLQDISYDTERYLKKNAFLIRTWIILPLGASQTCARAEYEQADGQRAGTSRDPHPLPPSTPAAGDAAAAVNDSDSTDNSDKELSGLAFVLALMSGVLVTVTKRLYKLSRNYRYVMRVLAREKEDMKAREDFGKGIRLGTGQIWSPMPSATGPRV